MYGEIGRFEMVAKLGEMELRQPARRAEPRADRRRSFARQRPEGQGAADPPARARREPDSIRVKDALAARHLRPRVLDRRSRPSIRRRRSVRRRASACACSSVRRASCVSKPRTTRVSKSCSSASSRRTSTSRRRTSCTRRCSSTANRWDDLERHQMRRADRAADHSDADRPAAHVRARVGAALQGQGSRREVLRRGARRRRRSNGASRDALDRRGVHAASSGARRYARRVGAAARPRRRGDRSHPERRRASLFLAIQAGHIAFDKVNDLARAKKYFAIAASIEPQNPNVQDFVQLVGPEEMPIAAGSMPSIPVAGRRSRCRRGG